jgi:signal transduction histidine kinase
MSLAATRRRVLRPDPSELVSLAERMAALTMLRFAFCAATLLVAALASASDEADLRAIGTATVAYAAVAGLAAATARLPRRVALAAVGISLLLDGVYLAWVVQATGGFESPLGILVALHVLAVTLIGSARTGLKVAAWHTLLAYVAVYGRRAQLPWFPGEAAAEATIPVLELGMLWAVGLVAAGFSRVQERELRAQKVHLERMSTMVGRLQQADDASEMPEILLDTLVDAFDFRRGVVLTRRDDDLVVAARRGTADVTGNPVGPDDVMEQAWSEGRAILRRSLDPPVDRRLAELLPRARNLIIVPMLSRGGAALGVVAIEAAVRRGRIRRWVVAFIEQFAAHTALSLHTAWLLEELHDRLEENVLLQERLAAQNNELEERVEERTTELTESLRQLRTVDDDRRRLLRKLVDAQEDERQRLAGDIHDDPVQKMVAASMRLQMLRRNVDDPSLAGDLDKLLGHVKASITSMRHLIFELRPSVLDDEGLAAALEEHMDKVGADLAFHLRNELSEEPPPETRVILYRIAQEALGNVRKHARADTVKAALRSHEGGFFVTITDDGEGFTASDVPRSGPGHLGLTSMRERAEMAGGWCRVHSLPGVGTTVEFWVPATLAAARSAVEPDTVDIEASVDDAREEPLPALTADAASG